MSVTVDWCSGGSESGYSDSKVGDQVRLQQRLRKAMRTRGNDVCVDCGTPRPRWATLVVQEEGRSVGGFCCLECSGAHRRLGTHVTFVRSVDLDTWKEKEVQALESGGNDHINSLYQAKISDMESALQTAQHNEHSITHHPLFSPQELQQPDCTLRLSPHATQDQRWHFVKDKYERRRFMTMDVFTSPSAWKKRPIGHESSPLPHLVPVSSTEDSTGSNHADETQQRQPTPSGYMKNFKFKWKKKKKIQRSTPSSPRRRFHSPNYNLVTSDDSNDLDPPLVRNTMISRPVTDESFPNFEDVFDQVMLDQSDSDDDSDQDSLLTYVTMKQNGDVEVVAKECLLLYPTDDEEEDEDDDEDDDDLSAVSTTSSIRGRLHENYKKGMRKGKRFMKKTFAKSKQSGASSTTSYHRQSEPDPEEVHVNMGVGYAL